MSIYTDFILLVDAVRCLNDDQNIELFNAWLKEEWMSTQPQFKETDMAGVFVVSINHAADGQDVIDKFLEIQWETEGKPQLMMRSEGSEIWKTFTKECP